jgi:DNA repair exonuclease SbcCD nuclease subunit
MTEEEVALKIVHTADWHLGRRFPGFDEADQPKLTRARLTVVDRILGVAESTRADAVLCAGDLFDAPDPGEEWWGGLADLFQRRSWRDRPVYLLPGNHDPLTEKSVYGAEHPFRAALPDWVHIVDRDDFEVPLSDVGVLYAIPCRRKAGEMDLALRLPDRAPGDTRIRIGLVHGSTFDMPGHQLNFPIAVDAAARRGLDYLAIGDTHAFRCVPENAPIPTIYPGTPEQTNFGERDTGAVAVVFFTRHGRRPRIRKERVAQWTWRSEVVRDLQGLRDLRSDPDLKQTVLRLTLQITAAPEEFAEVEQLLCELKGTDALHGRAGIMQTDRTGLELDTRNIAEVFEGLPEVLQSAARRLRAAELDGNPEVARRALYHLYHLSRVGI